MKTLRQLSRQSLAVPMLLAPILLAPMLLALTSPVEAGVRHPAPGAGVDAPRQQSSEKIEEEEYLEEDPDCG